MPSGASVTGVQLGAHVSTSGGIHTAIDRIEAIGGDCVQIFTQSPRAWRPTNHDPANFERFKERRAEAGIGGVVCHAVYLINLASPNDELYEKSVAALENTVDVASAIEADGVVFHVGSHQGAGFEVGLERVVPALRKALETLLGDHLAADREHRRHRRHDRPLDRASSPRSTTPWTPTSGSGSASTRAISTPPATTSRTATELDRLLGEVDQRIGLERLRALHVNDSKAPLGSNRDRHDNIGEGLIGEELGVFLSHPKLQGLPAYLEVPGTDGHGPDAEQVRKLKELHARAMKKPQAGSRRRRPRAA